MVIPGHVESIGEMAFYNCSGIISLKIEEGVKEIGPLAFAEFYSLKNATIPRNVVLTGEGVFDVCPELDVVERVGERASFTFGTQQKYKLPRI